MSPSALDWTAVEAALEKLLQRPLAAKPMPAVVGPAASAVVVPPAARAPLRGLAPTAGGFDGTGAKAASGPGPRLEPARDPVIQPATGPIEPPAVAAAENGLRVASLVDRRGLSDFVWE